jgi:hypothetical protein
MALSNVFRTLENPFYYGVFEYPKKSGNWYQGKHEPIVSKELYDKVQEQMKRDSIVRQGHEFAFTKLMICGQCGSGISAEEKYKPRKDGTVKKYVYYGCGRSKSQTCHSKYLQEDDLIDQLISLLDQIDFNTLGIEQKFEDELKRFNKFQRGVLGITNKGESHTDIDLRTYAKYTLKEGTNDERRELMGCFKSKIKITQGVLTIE